MNVSDRLCKLDDPLWDIIEILNRGDPVIALVTDDQSRLQGTITDGDIRRALLDKVPLESPARLIMNPKPRFIHANEEHKAAELFREKYIKCIPVVDQGGVVVDILTRTCALPQAHRAEKRPNPVFILAGGKGARLAPLTDIIPKPLIPINGKPLVEHVIDGFREHGFHRFVISLNYKGDMIESAFKDYKRATLEFVREEQFLGTAGSLALARGMLGQTFMVANCDVLTNVSFSDFIEFHQHEGNAITVMGVLKRIDVRYGVIELEDRVFSRITEKPQYSFMVNGGVYAMEPQVLDLVQPGVRLDMPDLIMRAKGRGMAVGVYPTSGEWFDVGTMDEFWFMFKKMGGRD